MRVIAGVAKGRRLAALRTLALRPTPARVRAALFNILGDRTQDACMLDLCAGTGALGLEALSRGAQAVVFVDMHAPACRLIAKNLHTCGLLERARVWQGDVLRVLPLLKAAAERFDLIFLDPPYQTFLVEDTLQQLGDGVLLAPEGQIVAEHFFKRAPLDYYGRVSRIRLARFGDVALSFYHIAGR